MIIKRYEMDVTNLLNAYEENELFSGKTIYEIENNLKLEVNLSLDRALDGIIQYKIINKPADMKIVINSSEEYQMNDDDEFMVVKNFEFKTIQNNIEKEYLILLKPISVDYSYDEFLKRIHLTASSYTFVLEWYGDVITEQDLKYLFYYEDATIKGLVALIYYYLYLAYESSRGEFDFNVELFREIINQKAEFVGTSYNYSKKEFEELIKGIRLKSEMEKVAILLEIINFIELTENNVLYVVNNYEDIFEGIK